MSPIPPRKDTLVVNYSSKPTQTGLRLAHEKPCSSPAPDEPRLSSSAQASRTRCLLNELISLSPRASLIQFLRKWPSLASHPISYTREALVFSLHSFACRVCHDCRRSIPVSRHMHYRECRGYEVETDAITDVSDQSSKRLFLYHTNYTGWVLRLLEFSPLLFCISLPISLKRERLIERPQICWLLHTLFFLIRSACSPYVSIGV